MKIAILGMGTVGRGCYAALCAEDCGVTLKRYLDLRPVEGLEEMRTEKIEDILEDGEIEAVVETMGGVHPAYEFVMAALRAKKHVVSSNKWLISEYWCALHECAAENGVQLLYTAAAGGGIPWLYNLSRVRRCEEILAVSGIINGTTNFILDGMHTSGESFETMLAKAQKLGYAEADPSSDIDGIDARRKCAISAGVAFNGYLDEKDIPCFGVRSFNDADQRYCEHMNRVCRLMFFAKKDARGVDACVVPVFVKEGSTAASVRLCDNYITLESAALGALSFIGQGAGGAPTGVAVVQDILDIATNVQRCVPSVKPLALCKGEGRQRYYIRKGGRQWISEMMDTAEIFGEGADFFARIEE